MNMRLCRRDFLKAVTVAGASGSIFNVISMAADSSQAGTNEIFTFVQMSDTHWGFNNPNINPDFAVTLKKAIAQVNALKQAPDFIVFTGDLTHTTDDDQERRKRMKEFKEIIKELKVQNIRFLAGEHDASLDNAEAFIEIFGKTHYTFDHKGVHFIAIDNVSDPHAIIGDEQLKWLGDELNKLDKNSRIIILTHRPLFDLAPDWDWATPDGAKAIDLLTPFKNVVVLYGHIHQLNDHMTGQIGHHSARGLMYPLPAPHSVTKKAPVPWKADKPYDNLGFRQINAADFKLTENPLAEAKADPPGEQANEQVIKITAKKFEYSPNEIKLKKGVPVVLELTTLDRLHGFNCPDLKIRSDIKPKTVNIVRFTPEKTGTFDFHCDIFCGSGHEGMAGKFIVTD